MLKTRMIAALVLFALALIFVEQNLSWTLGLYGIGEYSDLYSIGIVKDKVKNNNGSLYLVKTKKVRENLEFTYRVRSTNCLKFPLWPFTNTIVSNACPANINLTSNLFNLNFSNIMLEQGLYLFKDLILVVAIILAILGKILLGKSNPSPLKTNLYWTNKEIYH